MKIKFKDLAVGQMFAIEGVAFQRNTDGHNSYGQCTRLVDHVTVFPFPTLVETLTVLQAIQVVADQLGSHLVAPDQHGTGLRFPFSLFMSEADDKKFYSRDRNIRFLLTPTERVKRAKRLAEAAIERVKQAEQAVEQVKRARRAAWAITPTSRFSLTPKERASRVKRLVRLAKAERATRNAELVIQTERAMPKTPEERAMRIVQAVQVKQTARRLAMAARTDAQDTQAATERALRAKRYMRYASQPQQRAKAVRDMMALK